MRCYGCDVCGVCVVYLCELGLDCRAFYEILSGHDAEFELRSICEVHVRCEEERTRAYLCVHECIYV